MTQPLDYLSETTSQTAGPYVHIGLAPAAAGFDIFEKNFSHVVAGPNTRGTRIRIEGRVLDGTGTPVRDVLVESWQANSDGRFNHPDDTSVRTLDPDFRGWGRSCSDFDTGVFVIDTIKPGSFPWRDGRQQAPHVSLWIVARGINIGLSTRLYFSDETEANTADPVLRMIEQEVRRKTLVAERQDTPEGIVYRLDIHLQGDKETVFFDI